jgi:hypothetical protein
MKDVKPVALRLGQLAVADRTDDIGSDARLVALHLGELTRQVRRRRPSRLAGELRDQLRDVAQDRYAIHVDVLECRRRHRPHLRISWVLNDGCAPARLDRHQAGGTAVEVAGEHDADDGRTVRCRRRPKQRIDRRAVAVLFRTTDDLDVP